MSMRVACLIASLSCPLACGNGGSREQGSDPPGEQPGAGPVPPVDLLMVIDNTWGMDSKQALLADTVEHLVGRLQQPSCVDASGRPLPEPPASDGSCAAGQREFRAVRDLHVGVISSSLGDGGDGLLCTRPESRDMSHLVGSLERGAVPGVTSGGFLSWAEGAPQEDFRASLGALVRTVGQLGCGYEQPLEAWFRFLVDPQPYAALARVRCRPEATTTDCVGPTRDDSNRVLVDQTLLGQRAAFLRPDSLLLILTLSDENDCSIRVGGQSWRVAASDEMPRAASACHENPNGACCYSCGGVLPSGCSPDPVCATAPRMTREEDSLSLRCFDQKRRFGTEFLYPAQRYVNALTHRELCLSNISLDSADCADGLVVNPLFAAGRPLSKVMLASIIGVPWQDVRTPISTAEGSFRLKTAQELDNGGWDDILGQPLRDPPIPPADPFMIESANVRAGIEAGNEINGRDYDTAYGSATPRDLQHACLFRLTEPVDCSGADPAAALPCACAGALQNSPVCEDQPGASPAGPIQHWGRAYPGLRHLEVLREQANAGGGIVLGSVCPSNGSEASRSDYGYRAVADALLARVAAQLR